MLSRPQDIINARLSKILQQFGKILEMSYKQQMQNFRKEIRRNQLDEIFQRKRIKLLSETQDKMETEQPSLKKEQLLNMDLKNLAKLSQLQNVLTVLNEANFITRLTKYLESNFLNTDEQYYASYIMYNLSVKSTQQPSLQYFVLILELLQEVTDQKVIELLLETLANYMSDHPLIKNELIFNYALVDRIYSLFYRLESPTLSFCAAVSKCIIHMLNKSEPHPTFKKLKQFLLRFLRMTAKPEHLIIIKQTAYSMFLLTKMYPAELLDFLIKGEVFERLIELFNQCGDVPLVSFTFRIVGVVLKDMKEADFKRLIVPLISKLWEGQFQANKAKTDFDSRITKIVKTQTFKLINSALELNKLQPDNFLSCNLGRGMLQEFLTSEDEQIRRELVFIFTNVYLNISNPTILHTIERGMMRTRELDHKNMEIVSHINQLQSCFQH